MLLEPNMSHLESICAAMLNSKMFNEFFSVEEI